MKDIDATSDSDSKVLSSCFPTFFESKLLKKALLVLKVRKIHRKEQCAQQQLAIVAHTLTLFQRVFHHWYAQTKRYLKTIKLSEPSLDRFLVHSSRSAKVIAKRCFRKWLRLSLIATTFRKLYSLTQRKLLCRALSSWKFFHRRIIQIKLIGLSLAHRISRAKVRFIWSRWQSLYMNLLKRRINTTRKLFRRWLGFLSSRQRLKVLKVLLKKIKLSKRSQQMKYAFFKLNLNRLSYHNMSIATFNYKKNNKFRVLTRLRKRVIRNFSNRNAATKAELNYSNDQILQFNARRLLRSWREYAKNKCIQKWMRRRYYMILYGTGWLRLWIMCSRMQALMRRSINGAALHHRVIKLKQAIQIWCRYRRVNQNKFKSFKYANFAVTSCKARLKSGKSKSIQTSHDYSVSCRSLKDSPDPFKCRYVKILSFAFEAFRRNVFAHRMSRRFCRKAESSHRYRILSNAIHALKAKSKIKFRHNIRAKRPVFDVDLERNPTLIESRVKHFPGGEPRVLSTSASSSGRLHRSLRISTSGRSTAKEIEFLIRPLNISCISSSAARPHPSSRYYSEFLEREAVDHYKLCLLKRWRGRVVAAMRSFLQYSRVSSMFEKLSAAHRRSRLMCRLLSRWFHYVRRRKSARQYVPRIRLGKFNHALIGITSSKYSKGVESRSTSSQRFQHTVCCKALLHWREVAAIMSRLKRLSIDVHRLVNQRLRFRFMRAWRHLFRVAVKTAQQLRLRALIRRMKCRTILRLWHRAYIVAYNLYEGSRQRIRCFHKWMIATNRINKQINSCRQAEEAYKIRKLRRFLSIFKERNYFKYRRILIFSKATNWQKSYMLRLCLSIWVPRIDKNVLGRKHSFHRQSCGRELPSTMTSSVINSTDRSTVSGRLPQSIFGVSNRRAQRNSSASSTCNNRSPTESKSGNKFKSKVVELAPQAVETVLTPSPIHGSRLEAPNNSQMLTTTVDNHKQTLEAARAGLHRTSNSLIATLRPPFSAICARQYKRDSLGAQQLSNLDHANSLRTINSLSSPLPTTATTTTLTTGFTTIESPVRKNNNNGSLPKQSSSDWIMTTSSRWSTPTSPIVISTSTSGLVKGSELRHSGTRQSISISKLFTEDCQFHYLRALKLLRRYTFNSRQERIKTFFCAWRQYNREHIRIRIHLIRIIRQACDRYMGRLGLTRLSNHSKQDRALETIRQNRMKKAMIVWLRKFQSYNAVRKGLLLIERVYSLRNYRLHFHAWLVVIRHTPRIDSYWLKKVVMHNWWQRFVSAHHFRLRLCRRVIKAWKGRLRKQAAVRKRLMLVKKKTANVLIIMSHSWMRRTRQAFEKWKQYAATSDQDDKDFNI